MRSYVFVSYAESGAVAPQTALLASLNEFYAVTLADEKELPFDELSRDSAFSTDLATIAR
jgi:hypothetical protein